MELVWLQIMFSLLSGYQFQSGTASLVTGFVLILVIGNAFAWSFQLSLLVLLVLSLLLYVLASVCQAYFLKRIAGDLFVNEGR